MAAPSREKIVQRLRDVIPVAQIETEPSRIDDSAWDALSEGRLPPGKSSEFSLPLCLVRPLSTSDVQALVRFANEQRVPLVPYGGGSGLMGGALSIRPGIVVDMRAMDGILEVDADSRSARAQAGVVLESLEKRLNESGFILGHDPWTLPVATLGGAISTNSMGYRGGAYGSMGEQVLGLEAVVGDGEILRTRGVAKSSAGIDVNAFFIGGEGCFGIITEATIRIFPRPESRALDAFSFDSFERGYDAIRRLFVRGLRPALLDFGDYGEDDAGSVLYIGFEGPSGVVAAEARLAAAICGKDGTRLPADEAQRFFRDRHTIARRFMENRRERRDRSRNGVYRDWIHVALPAGRVLAFKAAAADLIRRRGARLRESGLWVQPELFSMRLEAAGEGAQALLQATVAELVALVQAMGGSMEYTHGVGIKLAPMMAREHGYGLEIMRRIKRLLDPNGILNPGKMAL
ncbi:MAG TPA: FAD-binding oxidoreductase [Candidatus Eisenbacteria bacterium]|nr:FAD-binding oxidoreductase [Candidatus Eisenbacteria bacterium]